MNRKTICLCRHGQVPQSEPRRFLGRRDLPLDPTGVLQAKALGRAFAQIPFDRIISSSLVRAAETARIAVHARTIDVEEEPALQEIDLGAWEGLTKDEVKARYPQTFWKRGNDLANIRPEGGESFQDLLERVRPVLQNILKGPDRNVLVFAHAGVNRVLLCDILGMPLQNIFRLGQDYGCLNIIVQQIDLKVEIMNATPRERSE